MYGLNQAIKLHHRKMYRVFFFQNYHYFKYSFDSFFTLSFHISFHNFKLGTDDHLEEDKLWRDYEVWLYIKVQPC